MISKLINTVWLIGCIALGLVLAGKIEAAEIPSVTYSGGRYYLSQNGVRYQEDDKDKYFNTDHTAKGAAVNLAFLTGEPVIIETPDITVTTNWIVVIPETQECPEIPEPEVCTDPVPVTYDILLTWSIPTARENETPLKPEEIQGFSIMMNGQVLTSIGSITEYTVEDLTAGIYRFSIATLAEELGGYSDSIEITAGE